jgi:hypothetical protein
MGLFHDHRKSEKEPLLREEVYITWLATSIFTGVLGSQFSDRVTVTAADRQLIDILFICIALFILFWATVSYFNYISFTTHKIGLLLVLMSIVSGFLCALVLSAENRL